MIYSNACAYAIRAMTRLAMMRPDGYVLLNDLCEGSDLPRHFVAKIFQDLVRKGLLVSAKGRGGGFALARAADKISIYDIVSVIDGVKQLDNCCLGLAVCDDKQPCALHDVWKRIREEMRSFLMDTHLEKLGKTLKIKMEETGQKLPELTSKSKPLNV